MEGIIRSREKTLKINRKNEGKNLKSIVVTKKGRKARDPTEIKHAAGEKREIFCKP